MTLTRASELLSDELVDPFDKRILRFPWYVRSGGNPVPSPRASDLG